MAFIENVDRFLIVECLSPRRLKDTRNNILFTKEFTVNIISDAFAEAANATSVESPANTDEWLISGLTKEKSVSFLDLRAV